MPNDTDRGGWKQLTGKQRAFLEHYLSQPCDHRNAAEAFRRAYSTQASPRDVARMAQKLLKNRKIAAVVAEADRRAAEATSSLINRYAANQGRIVSELARIAFASMDDYLTPEIRAKFPHVTSDQWKAVAEVKVDKDGGVTLKLHGKREALVDLARIQGLIISRTEVTGVGGGPIETKSEVTAFGRDLMEKGFLEIARRRSGGTSANGAAAERADGAAPERIVSRN